MSAMSAAMTQISQERIPGHTTIMPGRKTEMSKTKRGSHVRRLFCTVLVCLLLAGVLTMPALAAVEIPGNSAPIDTISADLEADGMPADDSAPDASGAASADTTADVSTDTPKTAGEDGEGEKVTLTRDELASVAAVIASAAGDSKAEDKRTPRDKFTAAYLARNLQDAISAVKAANDAMSKKAKLDMDFDKLTMADVEALITEMRTSVSLEQPTGVLETIKLAVGSILNWLTMIVGGNYVLGICVFSLIVELIMLPIAVKQQKNSIKQAKLQPKERAIRKKYAGRDDKATQQKVTMEIQEMYQKEGFSPASGCLPLLIQFPIIIVLYNVVINPIVYMMRLSNELTTALYTFINTSEAAGGLGLTVSSSRGTIEIASLIKEYGQSFFDKLSNFVYYSNGAEMAGALEKASWPNFNLFGMNTGLVPSFTEPSWLLLIPVLTFAIYFASMKLTRKMSYQPAATDQATGCSNTVMDISMPAMSTFICFMVPGALGIYWMIKSIFSTVVRFVLSKVMPLPQFTEEDYKAAEKEILKGKPAPAVRINSSGKPVRSLHHIDDEDFEDTRAAAIERRERLEAEERRAAEEQQKRIENSNIKNEDDRPQLSLKELSRMAKENRRKKAEEKKAAKEAAETEKTETSETSETSEKVVTPEKAETSEKAETAEKAKAQEGAEPEEKSEKLNAESKAAEENAENGETK